jgi:hypothetical protein
MKNQKRENQNENQNKELTKTETDYVIGLLLAEESFFFRFFKLMIDMIKEEGIDSIVGRRLRQKIIFKPSMRSYERYISLFQRIGLIKIENSLIMITPKFQKLMNDKNNLIFHYLNIRLENDKANN